jgi:hypothetical protein
MSHTNRTAAIECRFPALRSDVHEALNIHDAEISIELPSTKFRSWLHDFSRDQEIPLPDIFLALWGLILKTFTGNGSICSAFVLENAHPELVACEIDEEGSLLELLRSIADSKRPIQSHTSELPCNSAVYFARTTEENTQSPNKVSPSESTINQYQRLTLTLSLKYHCKWLMGKIRWKSI